MPWSAPYDIAGKLVGAAQKVTVGATGSTHDLKVTSVRPAIDQNVLKNSDTGNWSSTRNRLFPTKFVISTDTKMTIEGNFYMAETPDWVMDLLFSSGTTTVSWKPDGTTELLGGEWLFTNFSATFPAEDYCTYSVDLECSGEPTVGNNITEPT